MKLPNGRSTHDLDYEGPNGEPCVHVLYRGAPLCGFDTRQPADWPSGHMCVYHTDQYDLEEVTCTVCRMDIERDKRFAEEI